MRWALIPVAVLAVLWLLGQIRLGGGAEYRAEGFFLWLRIGPWRVTLFPLKKRKKKKREAAPAKETPPPAPPPPAPPLSERVGGAAAYARALVPIALEAAGQVKGKLRMDRLSLEVTVGADDPARAAMAYGRANAALGALWGVLNEAFVLKDARAGVKLDYGRPGTTVYALADLSLKAGQAFWLGIYFGWKALRAFLKVRNRNKQEQQQRKAA